ncbi:MAG: AraC family transcriptional regulator [Clostridia bacterium]|nr:AraC family transcriptional regulator [Clostridia bacterium]
MQIDQSYHFNALEHQKAFELSAFVASYYFSAKPSFEPRWESYNFSQIFLVLEGCGTYTVEDGTTYPLEPGKMFYRPAYRSSIYRWSTAQVKFGLISFVCDSEAMQTFCNAPTALHEEEIATLLDVIKTGTRVSETIKENEPLIGMRFKAGVPRAVLGFLASSMERFLSMVYCRLHSIDLLLDESQKVSKYIDESTLIAAVKRYLAEHLAEQLTVADICAQFGVSQSALMKKFHRETNRGMMDYFIELKINESKRLIRKTSQSFAEIAEALGFSTATYFSRVFKVKTGMTPTEYSKYVSKRSASVREELL